MKKNAKKMMVSDWGWDALHLDQLKRSKYSSAESKFEWLQSALEFAAATAGQAGMTARRKAKKVGVKKN